MCARRAFKECCLKKPGCGTFKAETGRTKMSQLSKALGIKRKTDICSTENNDLRRGN